MTRNSDKLCRGGSTLRPHRPWPTQIFKWPTLTDFLLALRIGLVLLIWYWYHGLVPASNGTGHPGPVQVTGTSNLAVWLVSHMAQGLGAMNSFMRVAVIISILITDCAGAILCYCYYGTKIRQNHRSY